MRLYDFLSLPSGKLRMSMRVAELAMVSFTDFLGY